MWLWVTLGVVGLLIAGLLVAVVAIPVFNSAKANAEEGECRDNLRTIDGAIMQYRAYGSGYSTNPDDYVPMYLKEWPTCPTDGSPPTLSCPATRLTPGAPTAIPIERSRPGPPPRS